MPTTDSHAGPRSSQRQACPAPGFSALSLPCCPPFSRILPAEEGGRGVLPAALGASLLMAEHSPHVCPRRCPALMSVPDAARAHPSCLSDAAQLHELAVVNITWLLVKACEHSFQLEIEPFLWEGSVLTTGRPASCIARNRLLEAGMSFGWSTGAMESQPQSAKRTPRAANRNFFW